MDFIDISTKSNLLRLDSNQVLVIGLGVISFNSKSIKAQITYEDKLGTQYFSSSKYEVDSDNIVKLIYRYGPFKKQMLKI